MAKIQYPSLRDENNIAIPMDWKLAYAEAQIYDTYGDVVSIVKKLKPLRKFGTNDSVGTTRATVMGLPTGITQETLATTNESIFMVSTSAADTTQSIRLLEGHTSVGTDLFFSSSSPNVTLTGQTPVDTGVDLTRVTRARLTIPAAGTIYFYDGSASTNGVPDDLTTVSMMILPPGEIQSQKASTAISSGDYYVVTNITAGVLEKTAAFAQVRVEIKLWTDTIESWYPITEWLTISSDSGSHSLIGPNDPFLIVPKNHDVRLTAIAGAANTEITGGLEGYLALII